VFNPLFLKRNGGGKEERIYSKCCCRTFEGDMFDIKAQMKIGR